MTVPRLNTSGRFDPASLFSPKSIAVIGMESEASAQIFANLSMGGFKGEIHALRDASQLPHGVDLAILHQALMLGVLVAESVIAGTATR